MIMRLIPWQIWAAAGVAIALTVSGWAIHQRAYNRGFAASQAQVAQQVAREVARQVEVSNKALAQAEATIAALHLQKEERDATIEKLLEEAGADPDADQPALDPASVRRLNRIR
jgi:hypothetical protein